MLVATELERAFYFDDGNEKVRLSDPDSSLSKEAVLNFYTITYPILVTAKIEGPEIMDDEVQYHFKTTIGTKG